MSTSETPNGQQASASSTQDFDPALEREIRDATDDALKPARAPAGDTGSPGGDGSLYLQNAHYGSLSVEGDGAGGQPGQTDGGASPPAALDLDSHPDVPSLLGQGGDGKSLAAGDDPDFGSGDAGTDGAQHRAADQSNFQGGLSIDGQSDVPPETVVFQPQSFSPLVLPPLNAETPLAPTVDEPPPPPPPPPEDNKAPTDIALDNTMIAENAAGAVVGKLSTVDPDTGDTHTYSVSDSRFEVVGGQLKLKDGVSLDHEATPNVSVTVTSTDTSGASVSEAFNITVANVNEGPTDIGLSSSTTSENAAGAVVGTLSTVDPDAGDTHSYSVSDSRFEVVGGQLKLKDGVSLDHEGEPSVSVTVTSTDASGASVSEAFNITVANVNEGPTDIGLSNSTISENAAGAVVGTLSTVDPDAGDTHSYTVSDARFEVVGGQLKLRDGVSLDHEGEPSVSVTVTSTDASGASVSEAFNITVANVNEGPTDIGLSNATISENAAGAVVGTLSTVDPDAGDTHSYSVSDSRFEVVGGQLKLKDGVSLDHEATPNVSVTVTSTDASGASVSEAFNITVANVNEGPTDIGLSNSTINENAAGAVVGTLSTVDPDAGDTRSYSVSDSRFEVVGGQLKLKDGVSLDHEATPNVSVTVTSTDASGASVSEAFNIAVSNVNEGPTDIGLSNSTISENAAGAVVGTLSTVDPDAGDTHSYSVSDNRFEVVGGQLKLKDGVSLDHEGEPSVSVTVTSTDASGASVSEAFNITVSDVNEGPTDIGLSNATISENAVGAVVGTLSTVDPDAGDTHSYSVSDSRFEVVGGQLKLKDGVSLDHEGEPSVSVTVTSTDASGASVSEAFNITVSNVNEGPTDIGLSNSTINENAAGAVVGTLSTVDPDAGDTHSYTVSDARFEVVDGQLKLKDGVSLDHEGEPSVSVTVTSTDAWGASVSEAFNITVANVNEGPTDIGLSNSTMNENAAGAVVGTLSTVDPDAGDTHSYSVSDNRFEVVGGQLKLKDGVSLDHEATPNVSVTVTSTDASGASVSEAFNITVSNVNEGPTDIGLSNSTINENAAGAVVGTLSTTDPDAGDTHTYSVSDDRFEVVGGQLKLKDGVSLDHEDDPSVSVTVTSTDVSGASVSESFDITVSNANEGPTDIALSNATVAENAAGAVVGTLSTTDPDAGDTHTYSVSDDRFEVVGGQLKLKDGVSLDHEGEPSVSVTVTSTDVSGASVSESFDITVSNANEGPTDIALSNATVTENAAGAVVGNLSTVDPDAGDTHSYSVSDDRFEVVGGQLKLKDGVSLDHEGEPSVSVTVTSTDASGASVSESFDIAVSNVNEGPTDIALSNATVAENAAGAVVGNLSTVDPDAGDTHSYSVSDDRFEVVGGQLKLKDGVSLDHEGEPSVSVTVTSTDASGASVSESFDITVSNANEGPNDIALSNATVAENAAGAVVGNLSTVDPDAGDTHSYSVSDDRFEVVDGQLKLKDGISLDHEGEPSVSVTVTSTDASGASVSELFDITVSNANEGPTDIALSNATVAENAAGAVVGTLSTVDPDVGDTHSYSVSDDRFEVVGGQLKLKDGVSLDHEGEPSASVTVTSTDASGASVSESFDITVSNANEGPTDIALSNATVSENAAGAVIGTLSTVDPDAGDTHSYSVSDDRFEVSGGRLKLKDGISLDHESEPSVSVTVTSTDASGASVSESFNVTVTDANEGSTDIVLSNSTIAENAAGAVVGSLSTIDPDAGDTHSYTVSDDRFEVVGGQLKLKDGVSLDHEGEPTVTLTVTSTDGSGASVSDSFTITVSNVNEGPTDIVLSNATVTENAAGAEIGALSTVDPDAGNTHTYSVSDNRFEVLNGDLKLKSGVTLDYEATPNITVTVTSTDQSGASYSEAFNIGVTNLNEAPVDINLSNATVAENATGAVVGTLSTVDPDAGNTHTYSVSDSRFEVVGGQLKLKSGVSLDYETTPSVAGTVTSTDQNGASYSEAFNIGVTNVNENPTDIALSNSSVAENAAGAVIGTLSTTDPDAGNTHTYSVSDNRFEVVGGQLKLKSGVSVNYETMPSVTVTVTSTDQNGASYSEAMTVNVTNVNENPTDIALSNSSVAENAAGAVVGTLSTTDPDAGNTHSYSVSDSRFEVVGGQLKLKSGVSLNYETTPSVTVTVTSTDQNGASYSEAMTVNVTNANEAPTGISLSNALISEGTPGGVVGSLTVTDPDASDTFSYSVSDSRFEVVGGQLKLKSGVSLDYEAASSVSVTVTATDAGGLSKAQAFTITVTNANDAPTDIALSNSTVSENAAGAVIGTLSTTDQDAGNTFTYSVSDNRFEVVNGQLKLKSGISLDYETTPSVTLTVTTTDNTGASYSEAFTISVLDANESGGTSDDDIFNGGAGDDVYDAAKGNDTLYGNGGNDKLWGGDGNDKVYGGDGNDTLYGDKGNDIIDGGNNDDVIEGGDGNDTLTGGAGSDTVSYASSDQGVSVNLSTNTVSGGHANGDTISGFENITGSGFADTLTGDGNANVISGGAGNDTIDGGTGNDTIEGGAGADKLTGGTGTDMLSYATSASGVTVNLSNNTVSGGDAAGDTITGFENVTGSASNDTITGDGNANVIYGGAGNDTIDGGAGNDTIEGGAGADTLAGGSGTGDTVSYAGSSAGVTVNLSNNTASGGDAAGDKISGFENVTGSAYGDTIYGNNSNNVINAGAGDDRVYVSGGIDTLDGGAGSDTLDLANFSGSNMTIDLGKGLVYYTSNPGGADTVSNFENASGTNATDTFFGNSADNTMWGQAGNDVFHFSTAGGHDTVYGGTGNDFIQIDSPAGSGGWLESVSGAPSSIAAGDWLLQLDNGQNYLLHGSGGSFTFDTTHAGVLIGADGSEMKFTELEGVNW